MKILSVFSLALLLNLESPAPLFALNDIFYFEGKRYTSSEFEAYKTEEQNRVKQSAEELFKAIIINKPDKALLLIQFEGFELDKEKDITDFFYRYRSRGGLMSYQGAEIIEITVAKDLRSATVSVRANYSTVDAAGGASTYPIIENWPFIRPKDNNKENQWKLQLERGWSNKAKQGRLFI